MRESEAASPSPTNKSTRKRTHHRSKKYKDEGDRDSRERSYSPESSVARSKRSHTKSHRKKDKDKKHHRDSRDTRDNLEISLERTGGFEQGIPKQFLESQAKMISQINDLKKDLLKVEKTCKYQQDDFKKLKEEVELINTLDPEQRMDRMQRKMIADVFIEKITPIRRDINVEIKTVRKILEECIGNIKDLQVSEKDIKG